MPATSLLDKVSTVVEGEDILHGQPQPYYYVDPERWQSAAARPEKPTTNAPDQGAATDQNVLLMQEVHHRVRNSLQMVQSLLNLQARQTTSATAARQLGDSAARIKAVGEMHNRLYHTENQLEVDIAAYLTQLVNDLRSSFIMPIDSREIILDTGLAHWPAAESLSLGFVLTELVTNALRYGRGSILIHFREDGDRGRFLIVEDEGTLPPDFDPAEGSGFGMRLIQTLLSQRGGSLMIDCTAGHTRFIAQLPPSSFSRKTQGGS
jgi:two-component sensor histidine kinase